MVVLVSVEIVVGAAVVDGTDVTGGPVAVLVLVAVVEETIVSVLLTIVVADVAVVDETSLSVAYDVRGAVVADAPVVLACCRRSFLAFPPPLAVTSRSVVNRTTRIRAAKMAFAHRGSAPDFGRDAG